MQHIIIIRHAPTDANKNGIFMGHIDVSNSPSGLSAAYALGKSLSFDSSIRLFTSPLSRSRTTLDVMAPDRKKIVDKRLVERALGKWEGCLEEFVKQKYPDAFDANDSLDPLYTPPGGEGINKFAKRVCDFLVDISNHQNPTRALVVTHNGVIAVMKSLIEERSLQECFAEVEPFLKPRVYVYDRQKVRKFSAHILEGLHSRR